MVNTKEAMDANIIYSFKEVGGTVTLPLLWDGKSRQISIVADIKAKGLALEVKQNDTFAVAVANSPEGVLLALEATKSLGTKDNIMDALQKIFAWSLNGKALTLKNQTLQGSLYNLVNVGTVYPKDKITHETNTVKADSVFSNVFVALASKIFKMPNVKKGNVGVYEADGKIIYGNVNTNGKDFVGKGAVVNGSVNTDGGDFIGRNRK